MCGVSFLYSGLVPKEELTRQMRTSLNILTHRGPDDHGMWQDKQVVIGTVACLLLIYLQVYNP